MPRDEGRDGSVAPPFRRISGKTTFVFTVDGIDIPATEGETIAAAMLVAGLPFARSGDRTAYCMIGQCQACRVAIDGVPFARACQRKAMPGMTVERLPL